ncbi:plasmid transfer protein TraB [Kitasatospora sp. NBC_00315]|uniref:plasmid transfer protein TraB n=1 Tax=Kitasatospora sp. NBC_00315 TaxID=2975963 RepID=UPI0032533827
MSGSNNMAHPLHLDPNQPGQQGAYGRGGGGVGEYLLDRAKPYLPPWLLAGGTGVLSLPAYGMWGGSAAASAGLTLASVGLTVATWWAGKSTTQQRRLHSAITVAAGTSWFTAAALAGPAAGPLGSLYLIGAPALAATWNIRQILRVNADGQTASADKGLLEKVGLAKTMVTSAKVAPNKATFDLQLPPGELTPDDVAKALPRLAGAFKVAKNAVRMTTDPDDSSRASITVVPNDLLKNTVAFPGPSHAGGSIADPIVVGIYEDGTPAMLWFPGDPQAGRNAMHLIVMGMTGSGKSEGGITVLGEVVTRRDVIVWASDPAKAEQTLGPLLPSLDWAALDMNSTKAMIEALRASIPARTAWLAKYGYKQWEPACAETQADGSPGMPYLVAWFEEAAKTIRETDDDVFTGIAQEARSAGISLVISLQRASGTQVSTDSRASFGSSWVFGVRDERDAGFALPDEALDAGAAPHTWKDKKPGYSYLVANGVPETFWATPARSYLTPTDYLHWAAVTFADVRSACDPVTAGAAAKAAGPAFTKRTRHPLPTAPAAPVQTGQPGLEGWDEEDGPLYLTEEDDVDDDSDVLDDDGQEWIDPEQALPEVRTILPLGARPAGPPARKLSKGEAQQAMTDLLAEFEDEGRTEVAPADFMEHCDRFGRSRSWVSGEVSAMVLAGRLRETEEAGRYEIVPANQYAA